MKHLIYYTSTNSKNRPDAQGAFIPEAMLLASHLRAQGDHVTAVPIKTTGVSLAKRREQVESNIIDDADHVWFLCHGWPHWFQMGYKWEWGAKKLVEKLTENNKMLSSINFFCCSVAKDKNNFAEWVFAELKKNTYAKNCSVFGHYASGHATVNPRIKIYSSAFKQPFIWSRGGVAGYNELIRGNKKDAEVLLRDFDSKLRFTLPLYPMKMKEQDYVWGLK